MLRHYSIGLVGLVMLVAVGCGGSSSSAPDGDTSLGGSGGTATGGASTGGKSATGGTSATGGDSSSGSAGSGSAASGGGNNVDDCADDPCQNGGVCVDGVGDYTCDCPAGYDGKSCENDVDDCTPNPCKNGGKCTDGVNDYGCKCPVGTSGANCEVLTIPITQSMMVGTAYDCEKDPPEFSGGECGTGESPGFTWTDATGVTPTSISIQVAPAWNCNDLPDTPRAVFLNGVEVGGILPGGDTATTCTCEYTVVPRTVEFTTTAPFVAGGVNTVTFAFAAEDDCESYGANPEWDNAYGFIALTTP